MIRNLPATWDIETDVVAIGSGLGGLAAAITAHDEGLQAMVLERSDQVGGVSALSMGEVWVAGNHLAQNLGIEDSPESGVRYLQRLSMGYSNDAMIRNMVCHGRLALKYFEEKIGLHMEVIRQCPDYWYKVDADAVAEGRMLESAPFAAATLGEWQSRARVSPLMPYGLTHKDIFDKGGVANIARWDYDLMGERLASDIRCLGPGLVGYFIKGALDRGIAMETGIDVQELIGNGQRVIGVRASRDGRELFIKANRGIVIAVSSYERNHDYNKTVGQQLDVESALFSTIDGAHFRLACPFGARIARVPDITAAGFHFPGEEDEEGKPLWRTSVQPIGLPHTIVVNRAGKRFGNEAFYRSIFFNLDHIDGGTQTHPNYPCWVILDAQAREKYPFASIMPGQDWPKGLGETADSIAGLAAKIGVNARGLQATIATFNANAEQGNDPEFGRGTHPWSMWMCGDPFHKPNPNLGPLVKAPFHAVELTRLGGTGIASAGLLADRHGRVLGWDDRPIEGLYVAGNSMARMETGAMMQSGTSNARGMTYGWLAARHAAGRPSDLLERELARLGR